MLLKKRLIAAAIDFCIAIVIITFPIVFIGIDLNNRIAIGIGVVLLFLKDVSGRSVGKKLLKLDLLDINSETKPTLSKRILRNISIAIWPVEVFLLLSKRRRIGDVLFHTKVTDFLEMQNDF